MPHFPIHIITTGIVVNLKIWRNHGPIVIPIGDTVIKDNVISFVFSTYNMNDIFVQLQVVQVLQ